jgi:hypothetical protein
MSSDKKVSSSTNLSGKLAALGVAERIGLFAPNQFPTGVAGPGAETDSLGSCLLDCYPYSLIEGLFIFR